MPSIQLHKETKPHLAHHSQTAKTKKKKKKSWWQPEKTDHIKSWPKTGILADFLGETI